MAIFNYVIFCERAIIDSATNNLSIQNTLEQLAMEAPGREIVQKAGGKPLAFPMPCAVVSNWQRSDPKRAETGSVRLSLLGPSGEKLLSVNQNLDLKAAGRGRLLVQLAALPTVGEGTYVWRVELLAGNKWKRSGEASYRLTYANQEQRDRIEVEARRMAATPKRSKQKLAPPKKTARK